jgi:hypothetical protein
MRGRENIPAKKSIGADVEKTFKRKNIAREKCIMRIFKGQVQEKHIKFSYRTKTFENCIKNI